MSLSAGKYFSILQLWILPEAEALEMLNQVLYKLLLDLG